MKFRGLIVFLFGVCSLMSFWVLFCTWKKYSLEKEAVAAVCFDGDVIDHQAIEKYLQQKYDDESRDPLFNLLGKKIYYRHIKDSALSKGPDMVGGRFTVVEVDQKALLKQLGQDTTKFKEALAETEARYLQNSQSDFIACFCEVVQAKREDTLASYFRSTYGIQDADNDKQVQKALRKIIQEQLTKSADVLRHRLDPQETKGYHIVQSTQGYGTLTIQSTKVEKDKHLVDAVEEIGVLNFYEVGTQQKHEEMAKKINSYLDNQHEVVTVLTKDGHYYISVRAEDYEIVKEALPELTNKDQRLFFQDKKKASDGQDYYRLCLLRYNSDHNQAGFQVSQAEREANNQGEWQVKVVLNKESAKRMAVLSDALRRKLMAITLDDNVVMCAGVNNKLDGHFVIRGSISFEKAGQIAHKLKSGALPSQLKIVQENMIGPSFGEKAQQQGIRAVTIALMIILLFMILYYAVSGCIANVALLFNILFIASSLVQFGGGFLTLPGIAGIVLTIGMAIDANVLIFERIREELRHHILIKQAVQNGYRKAYRSIIDANATTLLTGLILHFLGEGPIRSFADTLIIGIVCSVATAVLFSQLLIDAFINLIGIRHLSFSFSFTKNLLTGFKLDIVKKRKWLYLSSICFISLGIGLTYHHGLNWGTDFTGGRDYVVRFGKAVSIDNVEKGIKKRFKNHLDTHDKTKLKPGSISVRTLGNRNTLKITTNFDLDNGEIVDELVQQGITKQTQRQFVSDFDKKTSKLTNNQFVIDSAITIAPTMARSVKESALIAVICALIMMLLYIFISFRNFSLALGALVALIHDILGLFTCLAIAQRFGLFYDIDQVFMSTVLTVIGYSINDTVVIFDRIREYMKLNNSPNIHKNTINTATNTTLSRTLITSLTTLAPLSVLYFFGGIALEAFAFSLFCGIILGTYSSILLAAPLAYDITRLFGLNKKSHSSNSNVLKV